MYWFWVGLARLVPPLDSDTRLAIDSAERLPELGDELLNRPEGQGPVLGRDLRWWPFPGGPGDGDEEYHFDDAS